MSDRHPRIDAPSGRRMVLSLACAAVASGCPDAPRRGAEGETQAPLAKVGFTNPPPEVARAAFLLEPLPAAKPSQIRGAVVAEATTTTLSDGTKATALTLRGRFDAAEGQLPGDGWLRVHQATSCAALQAGDPGITLGDRALDTFRTFAEGDYADLAAQGVTLAAIVGHAVTLGDRDGTVFACGIGRLAPP